MKTTINLWLSAVLALLVCNPSAHAQVIVGNLGITYQYSSPTGTCGTNSPIQVIVPAGTLYACQNGAWVNITGGSGGSGTVNPSQQFSLFYQPNSGTAAVAQGDSHATTDGAGNVSSVSVNGVLTVGGPDGYSNISAAIAALPASGGTVQTVPGFTETESSINLGSPSQEVALRLGAGTNITINGAGGPGIQVFNGSTITCLSPIQNCVITSRQTGSPSSLITNGTVGQSYFFLQGLAIDCGATIGVAFTNGCVYINGVFVPSGIRDTIIIRFSVPSGTVTGLHITSTTSSLGGLNVFRLDNVWVNGELFPGAVPLVIDRIGSGIVTAVQFVGGSIENPDTGQHSITINGNGGTLGEIEFKGTQIQGNVSETVSAFSITDAQGVNIEDMTGHGLSSSVPMVEMAQNATTAVTSGTYTSGITATGTVGQTCTLTSFNDSSTATATVALTGTNTIASGTALVITSQGTGATGRPTSATAGSGTATCSGTATITTTTGGTLANIHIKNLSGNGTTGLVKNDVNSYASPSGNNLLSSYSYQGSGTTPYVFDGTSNFTTPVNAAITAQQPQYIAGPNLVPNPNFTGGGTTCGTDWNCLNTGGSSCTFLVDTTAPTGFTNSQELTLTNATNACEADSNASPASFFPITNGAQYAISGWFKNDGSSVVASVWIGTGGSGPLCTASFSNNTLTTTWTFKTAICTATGSSANGRLTVLEQPPGTNGSIWFTGVRVSLMSSPALPYFTNSSVYPPSGIGTTMASTTGTLTSGDAVEINANGDFIDAGVGVLTPTVAQAGGDTICAVAADSTIHPVTLTAVSSTSTQLTYTMAAVPTDFYVGQIVQAQGNTTTGYNLAPLTIASTTGTTVVINNSSNPGAGTAGGTMSLYCANQVNDALVGNRGFFTNNSGNVTFSAGKAASVGTHLTFYTPTANPEGVTMDLYQNSTTVLSNMTGQFLTPTANLTTGRVGYLGYDLAGRSTTSVDIDAAAITWPNASGSANYVSGVGQPVVVSASSLPIGFAIWYTPTGVASGTYTSGGTITGSATQTCTLTAFNDSSTATATVALTGTNTIAGGTALVITSRGAAATAAPTSATLGNGTATCSGTATIATVLGGSPGNAILQRSFIWRPY